MFTFKYTREQNPIRLANLIKRHKLFEKSHRCSRFEMLSLFLPDGEKVKAIGSDSIFVESYSTVVCYHDKKPVGILIFEHYDIPKTLKTSFIVGGRKRNHIMLGLMGLYVKPEFRKRCVATQMTSLFNKEFCLNLVSDNQVVYQMVATGSSHDLADHYMPNLQISDSFNSSVWKAEAKNYFTYSQRKPDINFNYEPPLASRHIEYS